MGSDRLTSSVTSLEHRWPTPPVQRRGRERKRGSLTSGPLAGTGSFRCEECGYVVNLAAADELPACPGCGGARFTRASLFAGSRFQRKAGDAPTIQEREALLAEARERLESPGQYLAWADGEEVRIAALDREWTRVGRSL